VSLEPTIEEQELLADTFRRDSSRLTAREFAAGVLVSFGFIAAVAALWIIRPPQTFAIEPALISALVLVLATRVQFDTPFGFTVPTQLGFVPLLFSAPVALVPVAVLVALVIARLNDVLAREVPPDRLLQTLGNSWFAIGPTMVFALADVEPRHAAVDLLLLALATQFVVDFGISSLRDVIARGATLVSQLRETWVYAVDAALSGIALVVAEDVHGHPGVPLSLLPLLGLLALFAHERRHRLENLVELNNAYRGTALALGDVIEADDGYTGQHSRGVVMLALAVGAGMGLDAEQRRNLEFAALLHDVGKVAIPKEIVNRPGKLTPEEWMIIKAHTLEGQKLLERAGGFMRAVGVIVRSHHERWDGAGYPDGLAGEAIPLEARIITCCDSWNAMRTDRAYRKALSQEVALAELLGNCGSQFDPSVVDALLRVVDPTGGAHRVGSTPHDAHAARAQTVTERPQAIG
jgi:HD-GYP domain-containing protein (c-di-GMP phosphodiesterase class II)